MRGGRLRPAFTSTESPSSPVSHLGPSIENIVQVEAGGHAGQCGSGVSQRLTIAPSLPRKRHLRSLSSKI